MSRFLDAGRYNPHAILTSHDTTSSPVCENINQKEAITYKDADNAINQPKFQSLLMVGITVGF
jgi:hypothetical protein